MCNGKTKTTGGHTFLSYGPAFVQACGHEVAQNIQIVECKNLLFEAALVDALFQLYTITAMTVNQILKHYRGIYSRAYLAKMATFLGLQADRHRPGSLLRAGQSDVVPGAVAHMSEFWEFCSYDTLRCVIKAKATHCGIRIARLLNDVMNK